MFRFNCKKNITLLKIGYIKYIFLLNFYYFNTKTMDKYTEIFNEKEFNEKRFCDNDSENDSFYKYFNINNINNSNSEYNFFDENNNMNLSSENDNDFDINKYYYIDNCPKNENSTVFFKEKEKENKDINIYKVDNEYFNILNNNKNNENNIKINQINTNMFFYDKKDKDIKEIKTNENKNNNIIVNIVKDNYFDLLNSFIKNSKCININNINHNININNNSSIKKKKKILKVHKCKKK